EPLFCSVHIGEHFDVVGVADLLAGVDVDRNGHWSSSSALRLFALSRIANPPADQLPCSSRRSCREAGISPRSAQRFRNSLAISSVTSRDQLSAVLKATIRAGSSYCPSSKSWISFVRLASASSVSRQTRPRIPK